MSEFDDNVNKDVDSIIFQLKNQTRSLKVVQKENPELKKEDIEKFILDNASEVVNDCVEMITSLKDDVVSCGDPKLIESTATLVNAFTSAIDALSKLKLSDDKINAQKELKVMDISAKIENTDSKSEKGVYISREELIKGLLQYKPEEKPPIDV